MFKFVSAFLILTMAFAVEAKTVTNLSQYRLYNSLHAVRVGLIGTNTFIENKTAFPDLTFSLVSEFLEQHDYAKLNDDVIQTKLFSIYGVQINTPRLQAFRDAVATLLNEEDEQYAYAFFVARDLVNKDGGLKPAAQQLLRLELIADYVDRYKNPLAREEFAREMIAASLHPTLSEKERWMAREAEAKYFDLIDGYLFSQYNGCNSILMTKQKLKGPKRTPVRL